MELFFSPKPQINDCIFTDRKESTYIHFLLNNMPRFLCAIVTPSFLLCLANSKNQRKAL